MKKSISDLVDKSMKVATYTGMYLILQTALYGFSADTLTNQEQSQGIAATVQSAQGTINLFNALDIIVVPGQMLAYGNYVAKNTEEPL